jgi:RNA recognition motif-containing protein
LKDLFRTSGAIIRADINVGYDGRPKGSGTVIFETAKDAQSAIRECFSVLIRNPVDIRRPEMYNGYDWYGRIIEVREVRPPRASFFPRHSHLAYRIATPDSRVAGDAVVDAVATAGSVVDGAGSEVVAGAGSGASQTRTCTLTIPAPISKWVREPMRMALGMLLVLVTVVLLQVWAELGSRARCLSQVNRSWFGT